VVTPSGCTLQVFYFDYKVKKLYAAIPNAKRYILANVAYLLYLSYMANEKSIGALVLIFGIVYLGFTIKAWLKSKGSISSQLKGLLISIGTIIIGIVLLMELLPW